MSTAIVKLRIENTYADGVEIVTTAIITVPTPRPTDLNEQTEWEYDHIFPQTGTGRTDGDAWYDVEIVESTVPELLGLTFEFGY
ncbi:hypothetical protein OG824_13500 [Streptomyces prunicolor]|uniref:hypothetical protein n=1 Tax=Streptomyces prunicolor TaxID=67348 RepID=UPI00224D0703|nr:hypothetical protein [Streptomyces prunicolor]MCX5236217.1 hypothetical protein [Streptomyces prunicolor]